MDKQIYEKIYDSVLFSFEEYIEDDGLNTTQTSAKVLEEDNKRLNLSDIARNLYLVFIANECFERKEIPDFIYSRVVNVIDSTMFGELEDELNADFMSHLERCRKFAEKKEFKVVETSDITRMRIDYIFSLSS